MTTAAHLEPLGILELGDPGLRVVSMLVHDVESAVFRSGNQRLQHVLDEFRARTGFGRAISAPQIGIHRRFIALRLPDCPRVIVDPEITWRSPQMFTMWDDCMSFPSLLVRVERHRSISISYTDEHGRHRNWESLPTDIAELLQHEMDHLDGVLAVDRAQPAEGHPDAIVTRAAFAARPELYVSQVDYTIGG